MEYKQAFELIEKHFDKLYNEKDVGFSQSDIQLYAWLSFKQEVWMTKDIANDIAKQLKHKYPYRYSRASLCYGNLRATV